jgi:hypothetical protein
VDGKMLVDAVFTHCYEPVDHLVLPYLCLFLTGRIRKPKRRS